MMYAMNDFMAGFFIVFGAFKIINLPSFVEAYQKYDLIARRSRAYAYAYPANSSKKYNSCKDTNKW